MNQSHAEHKAILDAIRREQDINPERMPIDWIHELMDMYQFKTYEDFFADTYIRWLLELFGTPYPPYATRHERRRRVHS